MWILAHLTSCRRSTHTVDFTKYSKSLYVVYLILLNFLDVILNRKRLNSQCAVCACVNCFLVSFS